MNSKKLKIYMAYDGEPEESAILVFAHSVKEAKKIAFPVFQRWCNDTVWINIRAKQMKDAEHLRIEGDKDLMEKNIPHYNDDPTVCKQCEYWGQPINKNGICERCQ